MRSTIVGWDKPALRRWPTIPGHASSVVGQRSKASLSHPTPQRHEPPLTRRPAGLAYATLRILFDPGPPRGG